MRIDAGGGRASITIPFDEPRQLHRLADPEIGDTLLVVTALGPARGFLKPQEFVEFNALVSTHGVVIQPLADDVAAELRTDKIVVGAPGRAHAVERRRARPRPPARMRQARAGRRRPFTLDPQAWGFDREADFRDRQIAAGRRGGRRRAMRSARRRGSSSRASIWRAT